MTIREALRDAAQQLDANHISNPRLTAEVLLAYSLSVDRSYLFAHDSEPLDDAAAAQFHQHLDERLSGKPLQYIVGFQEFYGRPFSVSPAVLIPRPETEFLVQAVIETQPAGGAIVDVGTGSGCIGVTLALELPESHVLLTDISIAALEVAKKNARSLGAPVNFACMDVLDAAAPGFDYVLSNPPYVSPDETDRLQREIREHEPHVALFAENRGMAIIERLASEAARVLRPGGYLMMEIGFGMEDRVVSLFGSGWRKLPTIADLQGIPRVVVMRRVPRSGG